MIPGLVAHTSQVKKKIPLSGAQFLGLKFAHHAQVHNFTAKEKNFLKRKLRWRRGGLSKALRFKLTIGAISRQRECSVGTQDSRQSMLNSSQRANAAKHRIRPAPPTQTQANHLLNQLPIVFFVTL